MTAQTPTTCFIHETAEGRYEICPGTLVTNRSVASLISDGDGPILRTYDVAGRLLTETLPDTLTELTESLADLGFKLDDASLVEAREIFDAV